MDSVLRAALVYLFLVLLFRIAGKRSLKEVTAFDLVLLLIISEAAQNAMVGQDFSLTNSFLIISTLIVMDIALSFVKGRIKPVDRWLESVPLVIVENGALLRERAAKLRVDESDVMEAARESQGWNAWTR